MQYFKKCQKCNKIWRTREEFLEMKDLTPLGFQAHFLDGSKSILLFHHSESNCNTTIAIPLHQVLDLIPNYFSKESAILSASCRGLCLTDSKLKPCDNTACRNSLVRQYIRSLYEKEQAVKKE